jgi:hypothetical protein
MGPEDDEEEKQTDEKSSFFKNEKQIEDMAAQVSLLAGEDEYDLPHYSVKDIYGSGDYNVDNSCNHEDGDFYDEDRRYDIHDYEYRDLPGYPEDERETQVFVG